MCWTRWSKIKHRRSRCRQGPLRRPRKIAAAREVPPICARMIPICSRFDSVLFTPKTPATASQQFFEVPLSQIEARVGAVRLEEVRLIDRPANGPDETCIHEPRNLMECQSNHLDFRPDGAAWGHGGSRRCQHCSLPKPTTSRAAADWKALARSWLLNRLSNDGGACPRREAATYLFGALRLSEADGLSQA
jgi:hypothetical protein